METLHQLASNLHLLLCDKEHECNPDDHDPTRCNWYMERQKETRWEESESEKWLRLAEGLGEVDSRAILDIFKLISDIKHIIDNYPMLEGILKKAISPLVI